MIEMTRRKDRKDEMSFLPDKDMPGVSANQGTCNKSQPPLTFAIYELSRY